MFFHQLLFLTRLFAPFLSLICIPHMERALRIFLGPLPHFNPYGLGRKSPTPRVQGWMCDSGWSAYSILEVSAIGSGVGT